jgi:hypothetical protein
MCIFSQFILASFYLAAATAGNQDYEHLTRSLTFVPGSGDGALMCSSVTILEDNVIEGEEDFSVTLALVTTASSLSLGNSVTNITLADDDGKKCSIMISVTL